MLRGNDLGECWVFCRVSAKFVPVADLDNQTLGSGVVFIHAICSIGTYPVFDGIGRNGHIGFNEPTSSLASRTRLKALSRETIDDNRHFFSSESEMPKCAITMGIGTILDSRRVLLLASGRSKAAAVAKAIEGPITSSVSASALQMHPDVTFIIDEEAAYSLTQRDYYRHVVEMTKLFTPERLA